MSFIVAENLVKEYGHGDSAVQAISSVTFSIEAGEFVALTGDSGAGKSTLLSVLGAMNRPTSGTLRVSDIDIYQLDSEKRADFRREFLGFVFQSFRLIPYLTVLENAMLPLAVIKAPTRQKVERARSALAQVGLADKGHRLPGEISGGEKERVAIARAIVNDPPIMLADEPTGNLDSGTSMEIMALLQRLNVKGTTIVMVTHNRECAGFAGRLMKIADGRLVQAGVHSGYGSDTPDLKIVRGSVGVAANVQ